MEERSVYCDVITGLYTAVSVTSVVALVVLRPTVDVLEVRVAVARGLLDCVALFVALGIAEAGSEAWELVARLPVACSVAGSVAMKARSFTY